MTAPTIAARLFTGAEEAAIAGIGVQIIQVYFMFIILAGRILYPHISGPYGLTRSFILKQIVFLFFLHALLYTAALCASVILATLILPAAYRSTLTVLVIFSTAALLGGIAGYLNYYLMVFEAERCILKSYILSALSFIVVAVCLSSTWGALGTAWASVTAFSVQGLASIYAIRIESVRSLSAMAVESQTAISSRSS